MTSDSGTGCTGMTSVSRYLVLGFLLNSCVILDAQESMWHGEIRLAYPPGEFKDRGARYMGMPVRECWYLYDIGRHNEWADCMGVEYK